MFAIRHRGFAALITLLALLLQFMVIFRGSFDDVSEIIRVFSLSFVLTNFGVLMLREYRVFNTTEPWGMLQAYDAEKHNEQLIAPFTEMVLTHADPLMRIRLEQLREDDEDVWISLKRSGLLGLRWDEEEEKKPNDNEILRLKLMRNWIASPHFPEGFRIGIQNELSDGAKENMGPGDLEYLQALQAALAECEWNWDAINNRVCELAKEREMKLRDAFQLMYWIVLDQDYGPKLASILEEMDRKAVLDLLKLAIDELSS